MQRERLLLQRRARRLARVRGHPQLRDERFADSSVRARQLRLLLSVQRGQLRGAVALHARDSRLALGARGSHRALARSRRGCVLPLLRGRGRRGARQPRSTQAPRARDQLIALRLLLLLLLFASLALHAGGLVAARQHLRRAVAHREHRVQPRPHRADGCLERCVRLPQRTRVRLDACEQLLRAADARALLRNRRAAALAQRNGGRQ